MGDMYLAYFKSGQICRVACTYVSVRISTFFHRNARKPNADLAEPLIKALSCLPIVPDVCSQVASAHCTCQDFHPHKWWKHVAAVGYQIIHFCETDPFYPFYLRQLDVCAIAKAQSLKRARAPEMLECAPQPKCAREVIDLVSDSEEEGSSLGSAIICG